MTIDLISLWSDSKTVLNHLQNIEINFQSYIMQRCKEIRVHTFIQDIGNSSPPKSI